MRIKLPRLTLPPVKKVIVAVVCALAVFAAGYVLGVKGYQIEVAKPVQVTISREVPPEKHIDFSLFWKVWDRLESSYFDKSRLDQGKMVYGAIKGMVEAVGDPYTAFLPPAENKITQEDLSGSFDGVGIQIGFRGAQLAVIAPLPGTPAEKGGVKAGDYIIGIKDEKRGIDRGTVGINLPEAVQAIRGPKGTKVTLLLLRDGVDEAFEVTLERATIDVPSVTLSFESDGKVAHLRLLKFGGETNGEWGKTINQILSHQPAVTGVVLDLRNNPGGYLQGAVDIASEFLGGGVVTIEEDADGTKEEFSVTRKGALTQIPLVVLVNKGSASASEILAGALRDHKRAKIVGETTFGKGTIQEPVEINGGAGLHVTIARWLTPNGVWVNEKGLEPDVKVEDNPNTPQDEQLQEALKLLGVSSQ